MENEKVVSGSFALPPADAPREVTQPLDPGAVDAQVAAARANERPLPPFDPKPVEPSQGLHAAPRTTPRTHQPAASNSDSPSRGIPKPILDPGKQITGGFGLGGEQQYFPLDGSELRELVRGLLDEINARLANDLRFHLAITYPRVRVRAVVEVEAYAKDQDFTIERIAVQERMPLEVARQYGDQIVFAVVAGRQEFTAEGAAQDPPNRIREELGLPIPAKQQVETPGGKMFVDRTADTLDGLF